MINGEIVVKDGIHQRIDHAQVVRDSDELQEVLLDETGARQYLRKRSRFTWVQ
jgi:hypothetical protein